MNFTNRIAHNVTDNSIEVLDEVLNVLFMLGEWLVIKSRGSVLPGSLKHSLGKKWWSLSHAKVPGSFSKFLKISNQIFHHKPLIFFQIAGSFQLNQNSRSLSLNGPARSMKVSPGDCWSNLSTKLLATLSDTTPPVKPEKCPTQKQNQIRRNFSLLTQMSNFFISPTKSTIIYLK